ncbi:hypothetical protein V490_08345 [Pseudogymnoascus sp. VKM F-3557]|nr:hypothetical protein V490_08345 [Pseudogymnoascus sp. VKM F-3557]
MIGRDILDYESVVHVIQLIDYLGSLPNPASGILPHKLWYYLSTPRRINTTTHLLVEEFKGYAEKIDELSDEEKLEAIFSTWPYQATNPKHKIFALQGLFKNFIMPDYEKPTSEVYCGPMSKWISCTKYLDLLRYAGIIVAPSVSIPDLPSWAPNWQGISSVERWQPFPTRRYSSDDNLDGFCSQKPEVINDRYMKVEGSICDSVVDAETCSNLQSADFGHLYQKYTGGNVNLTYPTGHTVLQAILRTILSDNYQDTTAQLDTFDSVSAQCSFLATLCALSLSRASAGETPLQRIQSCIEELGIAQSNHVTSFLKLLVPEEKIYDC